MEHKATFTINSWQEDEIEALEKPALVKKAKVVRSHEGYIQGLETMHYHLIYPHEKRSEFTGIGTFKGKVGAREGLFTFIERGSYRNDGVVVEFDVHALTPNEDIGPSLGAGRYQTTGHGRIDYIFTKK